MTSLPFSNNSLRQLRWYLLSRWCCKQEGHEVPIPNSKMMKTTITDSIETAPLTTTRSILMPSKESEGRKCQSLDCLQTIFADFPRGLKFAEMHLHNISSTILLLGCSLNPHYAACSAQHTSFLGSTSGCRMATEVNKWYDDAGSQPCRNA